MRGQKVKKEIPQRINIESIKRVDWIYLITNLLRCTVRKDMITIYFSKNINHTDFEPLHFVTLACFIEFLKKGGALVRFSSEKDEIIELLMNDLKFRQYWVERTAHVEAESSNFYNLWRITDNRKDTYAIGVEEYFKRNYFQGKDISKIRLSIVESLYNIFNHANADGNAFSFISYDKQSEILKVAICDLGKGIPASVRLVRPELTSDKEALLQAIEVGFTVQSEPYNKGYGLDTILSCSSVARIITNNSFLYKTEDKVKCYETEFDLKGTLIYFELSFSNLEEDSHTDMYEF